MFIGANPAIYSAQAGHYYARPGNAFWRQLSASGLAGREVGPTDDALLMDEAGIGFTDLCPRPTVRAEHLTRDEIAAGAAALHLELLAAQPRFAVFSSKTIFEWFATNELGVTLKSLRARSYGLQPERIGASVPFVIPSSSGLASRWHRERQELLHRLGELLLD